MSDDAAACRGPVRCGPWQDVVGIARLPAGGAVVSSAGSGQFLVAVDWHGVSRPRAWTAGRDRVR